MTLNREPEIAMHVLNVDVIHTTLIYHNVVIVLEVMEGPSLLSVQVGSFLFQGVDLSKVHFDLV